MMTNEQIREKAPSVFTQVAHKDVSDKYTHIPTSRVIEDMRLLGWEVVDAKQVNARQRQGFQKHLVKFQHPEITISSEEEGNMHPQVLLTNSHDGKNAFSFQAGLFRMICSNGLVIATQDFGKMKIRHMGYSFEELQNTINTFLGQLPLTVDSLNKMKHIEMEQEKILAFAQEALTTRFGKDSDMVVDLENFVMPTRKEDEQPTLWNVFNIVQEKLMRGSFTYVKNGRERKVRSIKNFNQEIQINEDLFELAMEYVEK
jgi:hypothetical protein